MLRARGIDALYRHQARALEALRAGRDVVLATPTASGKTLVYNLPVLRAPALADPEARALLLFPLKALERDQREAARGRRPRARPCRPAPSRASRSTTATRGQRAAEAARETRRLVLITTPDMLHVGILPHHASWRSFFAALRLVVIDELHTYRGVFGSHVAQVLRRLLASRRITARTPQFVGASATIANPGELAARSPAAPSRWSRRTARRARSATCVLLNPVGSPVHRRGAAVPDRGADSACARSPSRRRGASPS